MRTAINTVGDFFSTIYYPSVFEIPTRVEREPTWVSPKSTPRRTDQTLSALLAEIGTPWDKTDSFPPFNVAVNEKSGSVRFQFALSGIQQDRVGIEFSDGKIWLVIQESADEETEWLPIKTRIKKSVEGRYCYSMDFEKFDYQKSEATWKDGLLEVTIPLHKSRKPHRVEIQSKTPSK